VVPAIIILALWVALLAPGVVKWLRSHTPSTSIASFHRELQGLEHTGPKIVEPAYRLEDEDQRLTERVDEPPTVRAPRLVLLPTGATAKESTMGYEDRYQDRYQDRYEDPRRITGEEVYAQQGAWDDPWGRDEAAYEPETRANRTVRAPRYDEYDELDARDEAPVHALSATSARTRRTRILAGLGVAIVGTFVFGLLPDLSILWAVTLLSVAALVGYLVLMFYASNAGMYGNEPLARITPVARTVIPAYAERTYAYEEDWESERIAAAR
jgi:hypothetical protein